MRTGQRWIVSTGEYSDYGIRDSFVALKDFSFDLTLERWMEAHGKDGSFSHVSDEGEQGFLQSLRAAGLVADEKLNEVYLCSYSTPKKDPAKDRDDEPGRS